MTNYEATLKNCTDLADKNDLKIEYLGGKWGFDDGIDLYMTEIALDIFELETELYKIDENLNR